MKQTRASFGLAGAAVSRAAAQFLDDVCTVANVQASLPAADYLLGVVPNVDSVYAEAVTNYTVTGGEGQLGGSGFDFCNVTFSYTHTGGDDTVSSPPHLSRSLHRN